MALVDYAELVAVAQELIEGTGRLVTFRNLPSTPANVNQPWKPAAGAPVLANSFATFVPASSAQEMGLGVSDSELFRRAEQVCLVPPGAADLLSFQEVLDNGSVWRIEWIEVLRPGDTVLLYIMGVKR